MGLAAFVALPGRGQALSDQLELSRAAARVQVALAEDSELAAYRLRVHRLGSEIVLSGMVSSPGARNRAVEVARGAAPELTVRNQLDVTAEARRPLGPLPPRVARLEPAETAPQTAPPPRAERPVAQPRQEAQQAEAVHHTVRQGDTLFGIARQHGTTVAEIQRLNNLRGTTIRPGQQLRVR